LSEVIINLSLLHDSPITAFAVHSTVCGSGSGSFLRLKDDVEEQAEALVVHMVSPRLVIILTHSLPQLQMQSLDVLTGKRMMLADDAAWEDNGRIIEDSDSESEAQDDSSTASDF
jgi:hypothetical protein